MLKTNSVYKIGHELKKKIVLIKIHLIVMLILLELKKYYIRFFKLI